MSSGEVWVPRKDQEVALAWLEGREGPGRERAAMWLPTGTGKTAIAGQWLARGLFDELSMGRVLIVAPPLVVPGWIEQMKRWRHMNPLLATTSVITNEHLGLTRSAAGQLAFRDKRATKRALLALPGRVHLCTWHQLPWVEEAYGRNWPYDVFVPDESTNLRDQESAKAKAARRAVHKSGVVTHVLELTATPRANQDEAVRNQLDLIERGVFGLTLTDFRTDWCVPDQTDRNTGRVFRWKVAAARRPEFEAACARLALSLPDALGIEVLEVEQPIVLPDAAQQAHDDMLRNSVWNGIMAGSAAVRHSKLRQLASGAVYADDDRQAVVEVHDLKIERLKELVEEVDKPVVLAYQWRHELARLRAAFGRHLGEIRDEGALDRFKKGRLRILALHPASAGHGLDGLQHVTNVLIWSSVPEDRELYDQTNGRLKRGGQDSSTVYVHALVAGGTRESEIWREVLPGKARLQDVILRAARKDETS